MKKEKGRQILCEISIEDHQLTILTRVSVGWSEQFRFMHVHSGLRIEGVDVHG